MRRQNDSEKYELSDAEKRDLIKLINEGKPLPEKYRFLLFEDKREVELVWNGKTREVSTAILPFQTLEHIDEPRKEANQQDEPSEAGPFMPVATRKQEKLGDFAWMSWRLNLHLATRISLVGPKMVSRARN